jgi:hypothetical protein
LCLTDPFIYLLSQDSSVGIATLLRAGRSGYRIPVGGGRDFPHPSRPVHGAHPASYTMGTGSFPGVQRHGRGDDHPPNLASGLKKEYSYTSTPLWAFVACSRVTFTFFLFTYVIYDMFRHVFHHHHYSFIHSLTIRGTNPRFIFVSYAN